MFVRTRKLRDPVTVHLDGKAIEAERGEPLAVSLLAASELRIARSPKLHRPRGPSCLRGDCDGCLARVDDVPNVMLCMRAASGGERITTQNILGSRATDLLRITDWFFPKGIDHHHLMAGIPGVTDVMQTFARKLAGIGRMPRETVLPRKATRVERDVLVIGAGLAGTVAAFELSRAGLDVHLIDDGSLIGGAAHAAGSIAIDILKNHSIDKATVDLESTVIGIYDGEAVIARKDGAVVVKPRATLLATGAHDGVVAVLNNDLPGVMSARALARLATLGVVPDVDVAVVGEGPWAGRCRDLFGERIAVTLAARELLEIEGSSRVKGVKSKSGTRTEVSLVAVDVPFAPSFELAEMAGGKVEHSASGYRVVTDEQGRTAPSLWAVGECTGASFDAQAIAEAATRVASAMVDELQQKSSQLSPR